MKENVVGKLKLINVKFHPHDRVPPYDTIIANDIHPCYDLTNIVYYLG